MHFSLKTVKVACLTCLFVSLIIGLSLVINTIFAINLWSTKVAILGHSYSMCFKFAFFVGFFMIVLSIFGAAGAGINGYGMIWIYLVATICLLIINIVGSFGTILHPWSDNIKNLRNNMLYISPADLSPLQLTFRCCGFEKYTDYFMIWKLWTNTFKPNKTQVDMLIEPNFQFTKVPTTNFDTKVWSWGKRNIIVPKNDLESKKLFWKIVDQELIREKRRAVNYTVKKKRKRPFTSLTRSERFNWIRKLKTKVIQASTMVITEILTKSSKLINFLGKRIYGKVAWVYKYLVPDVLKNYLTPLFAYMFYPITELYRWWYGSGWDGIPIKYMFPEQGPILPYSCCKIPMLMCSGNHLNTWMEGCVFRIAVKWQHDVNHLVAIIAASIVSLMFNIGTFVILIGGVREKYYF